jgi:hypothetical protein
VPADWRPGKTPLLESLQAAVLFETAARPPSVQSVSHTGAPTKIRSASAAPCFSTLGSPIAEANLQERRGD